MPPPVFAELPVMVLLSRVRLPPLLVKPPPMPPVVLAVMVLFVTVMLPPSVEMPPAIVVAELLVMVSPASVTLPLELRMAPLAFAVFPAKVSLVSVMVVKLPARPPPLLLGAWLDRTLELASVRLPLVVLMPPPKPVRLAALPVAVLLEMVTLVRNRLPFKLSMPPPKREFAIDYTGIIPA